MNAQTQAVIPPGWVDATEAEALTGKTIKSIQRAIREGTIEVERQEIQVPGRSKPITIYRREDLERPQATAVVVAPPKALQLAGLDLLAQRLAELARISAAPPVPVHLKILLTLNEAHEYSGVPKSHLRRMSSLCVRYGRRVLYRRSALEAL